MSNRTITALTLVVILGMGVLFFLNYSAPVPVMRDAGYISLNDVRGSATKKNGKLWTLNFEQQNKVVDIINRSKPFEENIPPATPFTFDSFIIYRFNQPDLTITPVATKDGHLLFSLENKVISEQTPEEFQKLLSETYD